ncbi:MAG TPA: hypothetical protein VFA07_08855 [Chthonomonadaceae bacterium]|nr:hypothetical protein [Chthonomonadaceae bacterium]
MKRIQALVLTLFFTLLPLVAWAQEGDEDKPIPLTPQAKAAQLTVFGVIGLLVCLGIAWYFIRRWQILHSGNTVHGTDQRQD